MTPDGRYIAFSTQAPNLAPGAPSYPAVCIRDLFAGTTWYHERGTYGAVDMGLNPGVAHFTYGGAGGHLGTIHMRDFYADFDFFSVLADSDQYVYNDLGNVVYIYNEQVGSQTYSQIWKYSGSWGNPATTNFRVSNATTGGAGYGMSYGVAATPLQNLVAFVSYASNLVENDTNNKPDLFVVPCSRMSAGTVERIPLPTEDYDTISRPSVSYDGRYIAYALGKSGTEYGTVVSIYVYDRTLHQTVEVESGIQVQSSASPAISQQANAIAYTRCDKGISQIYCRELKLAGNGAMSVGDAVFMSKSNVGKPGNNHSYAPVISGEGSLVTYASDASNLVPGDTNNCRDIFMNLNPTGALARSVRATHGDPVDLETGEEEHHALTDLTVYNPVGPGVSFSRSYSTKHAKHEYCTPGLPIGWTHNYDVVLREYPSERPGLIGLRYPDGRKETMVPKANNAGDPPIGMLRPPDGTSYTAQRHGTTITITNKDRTTLTFTDIGNGYYVVTKITNAVGRYILLEWDSAHRLKKITDDQAPARALLTLTYGTNGMLEKIVDNTNRKVAYTYEPLVGTMLPCLATASQIVPSGATNPPMRWGYTYTNYNNAPLLKTHSMPSPTGVGVSTLTLNYDVKGRVIAQIDGNGIKSAYTYLHNRTIVDTYDAQDVKVDTFTQYYDDLGRNTGVEDANGRSTMIIYGDPGNPSVPTSTIDKDGRVTLVTPDSFGNLVGILK